MAGASSGKAEVITILLKAGADKNAQDQDGVTALMRAAESWDSAEAVTALLDAGAFTRGSVPRTWQSLCGVDRDGAPAA